jgi:FixJ family two-component response regulator
VANDPLIMCIDDDPSVQEAMKWLLVALGFRAEMFSSAEEFLRSDRLADASCLITDVKLSGMSGIELQNHLVESSNRIPVIVITAFADDRRREQALKAGAVCFLVKPVPKEELLSCIGRALDLRSYLKEPS